VFSIKRFEEFLKKHCEEIRCVNCGEPLCDVIVESYPHDNGIPIEEFNGEKRWVYVFCPKCKYENALWKIEKFSIPDELLKEYAKEVYKIELDNHKE